ncbi:MAG TPA: flagellar hook-associated protein FlgL [Nocardioides sp.]|uniref:flagellar hook-associated protein FlgL n=1 Tax=uncultured Nocardioides sp. TaxID=198441 RepID=UPI000ECD5AC1|nr:flagellar hook-associated protein FlgL [uncultured Nocardioides sp.]HCB03996.1 flagellar hook-associated protein 3 [Nocardioides sp.]HRD61726.1 flagellar hook-associated protein FlgL [Nocardioides sp.]HRI95367.1 flagellar hook-associated protein FlgL [Nocardioides sp.]
MTTVRLTQNMMVNRSQSAMQNALVRLADAQEQVSSGKRINRPSDSPTDTTSAMRLRGSLKATEQYARNAGDGLGRLAVVDQTLFTVTDLVGRARELALQGANTGSAGQSSRDALAAEVDQIRDELLNQANTQYLTRPVFGGVTAGAAAYDDDGSFVGVAGAITRRVGDDVNVRVDVDGQAVFGDGATSVFAELDALSTALRAGDSAGLATSLDALSDRATTVSTMHATVGATYKRIETAQSGLVDRKLNLTTSLSNIEDIDLAEASIEVSMRQVAYQAALAATAKTLQPSLMDFLR